MWRVKIICWIRFRHYRDVLNNECYDLIERAHYIALTQQQKALDFEKKDVPYFFLLDQTGKIVYATSGAYSERKMDGITGAIDELE